jgi:hypothetical protein
VAGEGVFRVAYPCGVAQVRACRNTTFYSQLSNESAVNREMAVVRPYSWIALFADVYLEWFSCSPQFAEVDQRILGLVSDRGSGADDFVSYSHGKSLVWRIHALALQKV